MRNLFNFKIPRTETSKTDGSDLLQRAQIYFGKMEQRAEETLQEVKESAQLIADADTDPHKRSYLQFKGAILAQFTAMIQKGSHAYQTQMLPKAGTMDRIHLSQLFNNWQRKTMDMMTHAFKDVVERNLEQEYAQIMAEYHRSYASCHCKQCGAKLEIDRFYFTATYLSCNFCQTQNTFDPGSKARYMEHLARPLAESRCKQAYETYRLRKSTMGQKKARADYANYIQAMIHQMNIILPGMEQQHQNFHNRLMNDYDNLPIPW
ncbi:MAG: hypothetical protein ACTHZ1_03395 [Sphingobacterium sp.]